MELCGGPRPDDQTEGEVLHFEAGILVCRPLESSLLFLFQVNQGRLVEPTSKIRDGGPAVASLWDCVAVNVNAWLTQTSEWVLGIEDGEAAQVFPGACGRWKWLSFLPSRPFFSRVLVFPA